MSHFKAFGMIHLQYEVRILFKNLNKATNDKTSIRPPFEHTAPLAYALWF